MADRDDNRRGGEKPVEAAAVTHARAGQELANRAATPRKKERQDCDLNATIWTRARRECGDQQRHENERRVPDGKLAGAGEGNPAFQDVVIERRVNGAGGGPRQVDKAGAGNPGTVRFVLPEALVTEPKDA